MPVNPEPYQSLSATINALNLASEAIVVFSPVTDADGGLQDMRIEVMNDAAVSMFGLPREITTGALLSQLWPISEDDPAWERTLEVLRTGQPMQYEWFTDNLGGRRWFEVALRPCGDGLAACYHEITAIKHSMWQIEAQKDFYEQLINHSQSRNTVLTVLRNEERHIVNFYIDYANYGPDIDDAYRNLSPFKIAPQGRLLTAVLPGVRETSVWSLCCRVTETGIAESLETSYTRDGMNTHANVSGHLLPDGRIFVSAVSIGASQRPKRT